MNKLGNRLRFIQAPIYVHRNIYPDEKDFGVSPDRINEVITRIL